MSDVEHIHFVVQIIVLFMRTSDNYNSVVRMKIPIMSSDDINKYTLQ